MELQKNLSILFSSCLPFMIQGMFEPYLKSFYIRSTDPTQIKVLKVSLYFNLLCCAAIFLLYLS